VRSGLSLRGRRRWRDALFQASLAFALFVAFRAAFPVNRWLIARGRRHAVVHAHHAH
jgi:hypothetical protein